MTFLAITNLKQGALLLEEGHKGALPLEEGENRILRYQFSSFLSSCPLRLCGSSKLDNVQTGQK